MISCTCILLFQVNDCDGVNCSNGTCVDGSMEFDCVCNPGYTGVYCDIEINECIGVECENGNCVDLVNNFTCDCFPGWEGEYCQVDINYCDSSPCDPKGTTECEDGSTTFTCVCDSGFTGQNCSDIDLCLPDPCSNGATCSIGPGNTTICTCLPGYTGELCELLLPFSICSPDYCTNNGTCQEQEGSGVLGPALCVCLPGFTGPLCEISANESSSTAAPMPTTVDITTSPTASVPPPEEVSPTVSIR